MAKDNLNKEFLPSERENLLAKDLVLGDDSTKKIYIHVETINPFDFTCNNYFPL